ncbi:MAG: aldehyde dehydrogenase [Bacteroidetes bacterium]|nr:aldehyde dehydrogenase [Bacteroidota bacterium]
MTHSDVNKILAAQRTFYRSGKTREVSFRIKALKQLKKTVKKLEAEIYEALAKDLHKPTFETYTSEIGMIYEDINLMISHLKSWATPKLSRTGFANFPARSYTYAEPFGTTLIIGAWNYPLQLTLVPLIGAVAAGNCSIVKPSELALQSSAIVTRIIRESFEEAHVTSIEGDVEISRALLAEKFDFIFFTGSTNVGKIVYRAAAEHLTPVVLELGGKSPCIVDRTADIELAAKRIAWGKFFNAGQSCVAPDYVLADASIKDKLVVALKKYIAEFFGENPQQSQDLSRIISDRHFNRLTDMLSGAEILSGGRFETEFRYIEPTIVEVDDFDHQLMQEEIFGPILPILSVDSLDEAIEAVDHHPNPLALYIFSSNYRNQQKVLNSINFGGGCVNDTVAHVANNHIPFGGIGTSGIGRYHGKASFETFSHFKSVMHKAAWPDVPLRYPPYKGKLGIVKQIIK